MQPALNTAITAARKAGDILLQYRERLDRIQISKKAHQDYVSEVDVLAEQAVIQILSKAYPHHGFMAEESGISNTDAIEQWIIDPLDGTTNYIHDYPFFCVSIALKVKNRVECGVIFDPVKQECFIAERGAGARLNDKRLRVSKTVELSEALFGTNFSFAPKQDDSFKAGFEHIVTTVAGIRKVGAAALELAYIAAGRLDGFVGINLRPWDLAAGALLVQEAGGMVSDLTGQDYYLKQGHILAGNAKVFRAGIQHFVDLA
ncbi:MAG: inositol monophosphatase family protein [Gammaproteobacteria bacterium]|nr:inositol monophosphatase family protein [Gammaproteobacteria bacterium]